MGNESAQRYEQIADVLGRIGQVHLLSFWDKLDDVGKRKLLGQLEQINWQEIERLIQSHVRHRPYFTLPRDIQPAPFYPAVPDGQLRDKYARARAVGERLIGEGKVAAMVVAGGSGTRLGWDAPKGTFPTTPVTGKPLFQLYAESIHKVELKYRTSVPWYIMTSPANDVPTRAFFDEHGYFDLDPRNVFFFAQGTMPAIGLDGKVLLESEDSLALSADGHGGSLKALHKSGATADMMRRGVQYISYFQVDNPLVRCVDPLFVGLHAMDKARMSSKMVAKLYGKEKLGNFCKVDGRITIIEYSDLPDELAQKRDASGELWFRAGSPAIHVISVDFVEKLNASGELSLPWHRADKKVSYIDPATGRRIEPAKPNAVKLEQFVFDALPLCDVSIVLETPREEEMAFIKNAEGESSPASSRQMQIDRAARWLEDAGVEIPRKPDGGVDAVIEISPLTAVEPDDLHDATLPKRIEAGQTVVV